jgi:hypothetical protein
MKGALPRGNTLRFLNVKNISLYKPVRPKAIRIGGMVFPVSQES